MTANGMPVYWLTLNKGWEEQLVVYVALSSGNEAKVWKNTDISQNRNRIKRARTLRLWKTDAFISTFVKIPDEFPSKQRHQTTYCDTEVKNRARRRPR